MRFKYDKSKSAAIQNNPARGISFDDIQMLWEKPYYLDQRSEMPEQWRAIGWVGEKLYTVIYEDRSDAEGEYIHLVTLWQSTKEERSLYEKNSKG
jgi:uncharacterized DUF497 family protein